MSIKVPSQKGVRFEAFLRGTEENIEINDKDMISITPSASPNDVNVLRLPDLIGMLSNMNYMLRTA